MSADLSRKQSSRGSNGQTILPQAVGNPSIIESVAGFIHEVVPQAYSSVLPGETRESVSWARFEVTDYNDPENYSQVSECESESTPPLLLVLGYSTGVQVWSINGGGDATELLSWSQGAVRTLRLLDRPKDGADLFINKRPLVAVVDSSGPGPQFCTVNFVSLKTAEVIKSIKFKTPICDIHCNKKSVVITFTEKIAVFDVGTLEDRLTVTTCYPSPGTCINPVALGSRWLAYAEKRLTTWQRSSGGCESDGSQSYTATVIHAAKSLSKGLRDLSGSLTGSSPSTTNNNAAHAGIVTIIDIELKPTKEDDPENLICHFVGHVGPIVAMTFDPSGLLLVTADKHGHRFHVYRIQPHPCCAQLAAVHHLYILHRGETTARVQDITVSLDSRWVAVSSVRGTTHVFPITPYGGPVTVRTHTTPHVVNRLSRFERSAGLSDGRGSPLPEVPCQPSTPRLPPYPVPCVLLPLAQIRRTDESPLAAMFAVPRAWLPGQPVRQGKRSLLDSLFVISSGGSLIQYDLDPRPTPGVAKDKISYDTGIELGVDAKAEWPLLKAPYSSSLQPPLPVNNPLLATSMSEQHTPDPRTVDDRWMSQVEIVTHTGPHRRLWMGPQFSFKSMDPLAPSVFEINPQNDNMKPNRSNPVNMPHRPFLLVETGSGGSVESPHLTDYGSSSEDVQHGESRLREDLADAMLETAANSSGVLVGAVGGGEGGTTVSGGRLRAAVLERQVNPLGTVITLPAAGGQDPHSTMISIEQRRHQHQQLYQQVLPTSSSHHVVHHRTVVEKQQQELHQKSPAAMLSNVVLGKKEEGEKVTLKTTCAEVQTMPLPIETKAPNATKSIQTTTAEKKIAKGEQKVKSKGKKKSSTSAALGEPNISTSKTTENIVEQPSSAVDAQEHEVEKLEIKSAHQMKIQYVVSDVTKVDPEERKVGEDTKRETGLFEEDQKEVESISYALAGSVADNKKNTDKESAELPEPAPELSNQPDEETLLKFEPLIDPLLETKSEKQFERLESSCLGLVIDVEPLKGICETNILTGDLCLTSSEKTESIEESVNACSSAVEGKVSCEDIDRTKDEPSTSAADDANDLQHVDDDQDHETLATSSSNLLEENLPRPNLVEFVDDGKSDIISSLEKSNESAGGQILNYEVDIESGESSSQKEESSVTGNDDLVTDSSDDRKFRKELSRKAARAQEVETVKDPNETKKLSTSPTKLESAKDDTESSDEPTSSKTSDSKTNTLKQIKRKKSGKKSSEHTSGTSLAVGDDESSSTSVDIATKLKSKCHSESTLDVEKSDYETCSEKKSDSSIESFPEYKKKMDEDKTVIMSETKSWSSVVKRNTTATNDKEPLRPSNSAEDRDSVYESCNDEDFPTLEVVFAKPVEQQTALECSKDEVFEEPKLDITKMESGSSNTEEKTDSGERDMFTSIKNLKKVKKQKKRKR
ncbi:uncharacterized protein [Rhodnius prolixus]|uniref:uncharacterized protein n=1 Tax=Rhodnius prolixus TaxID=13249 RepID=UPI003D18BBA4